MAEFSILGPVEVLTGGRAVNLGGRKQAALLTILLLGRGEVQSSEHLIDLLWGERPPATAAKTLQVYVSNLRKALGADTIVTVGRGYRLVVADGDLDADRFESLTAQGRRALADDDPARARHLLDEARSLWRGEPLADFAYEPFAQAEIARLSEVRIGALEDRLEADLALGQHDAAVPELEGLVRRHPTRERLLGLLMLALYRSGRQVDALEAYRSGRQALSDELGLEPSPRLRELEQAILRHDPSLEAPRQRSRTPRAPVVRGGSLIAAGGAVLLAAAIAAIVVAVGSGSAANVPVANTVAAIDVSTNQVVGHAQVGAGPGPVAFGSGSVWVANAEDETVSQLDPRTLRALRTLPVGDTPTSIATSAGAVWVVTSSPNATSVDLRRIDPRFDLVGSPTRIANVVPGGSGSVAANAGAVWVAPSNGELVRIDPASGTVAQRVDPNVSPNAIAIGDGSEWVTGGDADNVMRVDATGARTAIPVDKQPTAIAVGARAVWTVDTLGDTVVRIDPATDAPTNTVPVGDFPSGVAVGAGSVWVANSGDGTVTRIDPHTDRVIATINVGGSPQALAVADDRVWVTIDAAGVRPAGRPQGGVLRIDLAGTDVDYMDPALAYLGSSWQLLQATCAKLLNYPDKPGPAGSQLTAEVAQAQPERSADGKTYTFTIRPGFRFSPPSNAPVTAQTFKYTIERSLNARMASPFDYQFKDIVGAAAYMAGKASHISGVIASGDKLIIRLLRPDADLPTRVAQPVFCAVPVGTPIDPKGLHAIPMAGPYYIASYAPGQGIVLKLNPNYGGGRPHSLAEIDVAVNVPPARVVAQLQAGTADYAPHVPPGSIRALAVRYGPGSRAAARGRQRYFVHPVLQLWLFVLNPHRPLFSAARIRRAANFAVDRTALTRAGSFEGLGAPGPEPTDQYLPPGLPGYHDVSVYGLTGNVARARALAAGEHATAVLDTCNESECRGQAEVLRADLARIGIALRVRQLPWGDLFAAIKRPVGWDLALLGWQVDYADPADFLNFLLEGGTLAPPFEDPPYQRQLARAERLSGPERYLAYGALATELDRDAAPWIAWGNEGTHEFFSARVGCQIDGIYDMDLAALCIRPRRR